MKFSRILILTLVGSCSLVSNAFADPSSDYTQDTQAAHQSTQSGINQIQNFNANSLPFYGTPPPQTQYENDPSAMASDAQAQAASDPTTQTVIGAISGGKEIVINPNSPAQVASHNAQLSAADIANGVSDPNFNCQQPICQTTWQTQTCNESSAQTVSCVSDLSVIVTPSTAPTPASGSFGGGANSVLFPQGTITSLTVNINGRIDFFCNMPASVSINGVLIQTIKLDCSTGKQYTFSNNNLNIVSDGKTPLSLSINAMSEFSWQSGSWSGSINEASHTEQDSWSGDCQSQSTICQTTAVNCTQGAATKVINGYSVTRPCWENTTNLMCGSSGQSGASCQPYLQQGCIEVSHDASGTTQMNCPTTTCSGSQNVCGSGSQFCINGSCYQSSPSSSSSFGKSGSELAAASQSAGQGANSPNSPSIFTGTAMQCSDKWLGTVTCCSDQGWINHNIPALAQCTDEEKKLGVAREQGLTIGLGSYCSNKIAGICTETSEGYCAFADLLSFDVQSQGRGNQLQIPFGSAQSPNCRGLMVSEIQKIDFSKIDFTNFYATYQSNTNFPDPNQIQQQIENNINQQLGGG